MKADTTYYFSDGSRAAFVILGLIVVCAAIFFVQWSFDKIEFAFEFANLLSLLLLFLCVYLGYKGIIKLYVLIRYNIPIIELYNSFMIVALYPGGKYTSAYKAFFGKYDYAKINYSDIKSIYRNKKFMRMDYSNVQGYTFIEGTIDGQKFDVPTLIGAIEKSNYILLKVKLNQAEFDVSNMI
ncbi:hypothetical protein ACFSX9_15420 [Flavobacterium ardleyense]|uniref:Uncharacterized protein n=1 Tax=Flavobacterium ardleyense TaxID=2038737 RepID=A0ABW5ZB58_9FLAO